MAGRAVAEFPGQGTQRVQSCRVKNEWGGAQALPRKGVDNMAIWVKALWVTVSGLAMMVEIDALHSEEGNICKVFMAVAQFIMIMVAVQVL